jgi:hypothetical protein
MSHSISLASAATMTAAFRTDKETVLDSSYKNLGILPLCETFDRTEVYNLLQQTGCAAIRIYYGMDGDLKVHAVLVGVDAEDSDMVGETNIILENSRRCPYDCPGTSDLNS